MRMLYESRIRVVHTGSGTRFRLGNGAARCSHGKRHLTILRHLTVNFHQMISTNARGGAESPLAFLHRQLRQEITTQLV